MSDRKNFFYYLLPSIISGAIGILVLPITTYYLDPKDFGVYAILSALVMPVVALSSTGAGWVLGGNFYRAQGDDNKRMLFNLLFFDFIFKFCWIAVLWFLSPVILPLIVNGYEVSYNFFFKMSLLSILISSFTASISFFLVLQRRAAIHSLVEIIGPLSGALITIVCLSIFKYTTISLFLGPLVAEILSAMVGLWCVRHHIKLELSYKWFKEIVHVGLPAIPLDLIGLLTNISDKYFVQRWLNLSTLGIYSHSVNYKSIFSLTFKAFNRTYAPKALEHFSMQTDANNLKYGLGKWLGLAGLAGVFIALFSTEIVNILSHGKFIQAAPLVPLWFLIIFSYAFGTTYQQFLFAHKKSLYLTISGVIVGLFSILMVGLGVYAFGMLGAVVASLLANFITQCTFKIYARKLGCISIGDRDIFTLALFIFSMYLLNLFVGFDLVWRVAMWILLSVAVVYQYKLLATVRRQFKGENQV